MCYHFAYEHNGFDNMHTHSLYIICEICLISTGRHNREMVGNLSLHPTSPVQLSTWERYGYISHPPHLQLATKDYNILN